MTHIQQPLFQGASTSTFPTSSLLCLLWDYSSHLSSVIQLNC